MIRLSPLAAALACAIGLTSCAAEGPPTSIPVPLAQPSPDAFDPEASVPPSAELPTFRRAEPVFRYVALGDSFTAAPLVPTTDTSDLCLRSDGNYPSLVAAGRLGTELVDVSCGGAVTDSLWSPQDLGSKVQPPQFDAVTPDTDLVTLSIGGNDDGLFVRLILRCSAVLDRDPDPATCAQPAEPARDPAFGTIDRVEEAVADAVVEITRRAPEARILVVNYPQFLPRRGACAALGPFVTDDFTHLVEINRALSAAVASGARRSGAGVIDIFRASRNHHICADEPWINGILTDLDAAAAFHPFANEQEAVARLILARVGAS